MECPKCGSPVMAQYRQGEQDVAQCYNTHLWKITAKDTAPTVVNAATRLVASHTVKAESIEDYTQRLKKLGIKQIGEEGAAGVVFQHPTLKDVAVKLLVEEDNAYKDYVKFCQKNPSNPYLPKIHKVSKAKNAFDGNYGRATNDLYLVFMEKLTPISTREYNKFASYCSKLANERRTDKDISWTSGYFDSKEKLNLDDFWQDVARNRTDPMVAKTAKYLFQASRRYTLDMHQMNLMKRGTQVVLIDPFSVY